jgi:hypothetical protein
MKKSLFFLLLLSLAAPSYGQITSPNEAPKAAAVDEDETVRITDNNILFFYEAKADIPWPMESLAQAYSPEYNSDNVAFPSEFSGTTFIPIQNLSYAVQFSNVKDFAFIPVPIEAARKFQIQLRQSRSVNFEITLNPQGCETKVMNSAAYSVIQATILSFHILMPGGQVLAEKKLKPTPLTSK